MILLVVLFIGILVGGYYYYVSSKKPKPKSVNKGDTVLPFYNNGNAECPSGHDMTPLECRDSIPNHTMFYQRSLGPNLSKCLKFHSGENVYLYYNSSPNNNHDPSQTEYNWEVICKQPQ